MYIYIYHIVKCIKSVLKCIKVYYIVLSNTVDKCIRVIQFNTGYLIDN